MKPTVWVGIAWLLAVCCAWGQETLVPAALPPPSQRALTVTFDEPFDPGAWLDRATGPTGVLILRFRVPANMGALEWWDLMEVLGDPSLYEMPDPPVDGTIRAYHPPTSVTVLEPDRGGDTASVRLEGATASVRSRQMVRLTRDAVPGERAIFQLIDWIERPDEGTQPPAPAVQTRQVASTDPMALAGLVAGAATQQVAAVTAPAVQGLVEGAVVGSGLPTIVYEKPTWGRDVSGNEVLLARFWVPEGFAQWGKVLAYLQAEGHCTVAVTTEAVPRPQAVTSSTPTEVAPDGTPCHTVQFAIGARVAQATYSLKVEPVTQGGVAQYAEVGPAIKVVFDAPAYQEPGKLALWCTVPEGVSSSESAALVAALEEPERYALTKSGAESKPQTVAISGASADASASGTRRLVTLAAPNETGAAASYSLAVTSPPPSAVATFQFEVATATRQEATAADGEAHSPQLYPVAALTLEDDPLYTDNDAQRGRLGINLVVLFPEETATKDRTALEDALGRPETYATCRPGAQTDQTDARLGRPEVDTDAQDAWVVRIPLWVDDPSNLCLVVRPWPPSDRDTDAKTASLGLYPLWVPRDGLGERLADLSGRSENTSPSRKAGLHVLVVGEAEANEVRGYAWASVQVAAALAGKRWDKDYLARAVREMHGDAARRSPRQVIRHMLSTIAFGIAEGAPRAGLWSDSARRSLAERLDQAARDGQLDSRSRSALELAARAAWDGQRGAPGSMSQDELWNVLSFGAVLLSEDAAQGDRRGLGATGQLSDPPAGPAATHALTGATGPVATAPGPQAPVAPGPSSDWKAWCQYLSEPDREVQEYGAGRTALPASPEDAFHLLAEWSAGYAGADRATVVQPIEGALRRCGAPPPTLDSLVGDQQLWAQILQELTTKRLQMPDGTEEAYEHAADLNKSSGLSGSLLGLSTDPSASGDVTLNYRDMTTRWTRLDARELRGRIRAGTLNTLRASSVSLRQAAVGTSGEAPLPTTITGAWRRMRTFRDGTAQTSEFRLSTPEPYGEFDVSGYRQWALRPYGFHGQLEVGARLTGEVRIGGALSQARATYLLGDRLRLRATPYIEWRPRIDDKDEPEWGFLLRGEYSIAAYSDANGGHIGTKDYWHVVAEASRRQSKDTLLYARTEFGFIPPEWDCAQPWSWREFSHKLGFRTGVEGKF